MPGPPPKRPERRTRQPRGALAIVPSSGAVRKPPAPQGLTKAVTEAWAAFWASELAPMTLPADMIALRRLFRLYDQRERFAEAGFGEALTEGSTGQMVLNPLIRHLPTLDAEILALEDRFGLSPMARLNTSVRSNTGISTRRKR